MLTEFTLRKLAKKFRIGNTVRIREISHLTIQLKVLDPQQYKAEWPESPALLLAIVYDKINTRFQLNSVEIVGDETVSVRSRELTINEIQPEPVTVIAAKFDIAKIGNIEILAAAEVVDLREPIRGQTFADLGTPFPLFEGPVDCASEYCGEGTCLICNEAKPVCFELGIGSSLALACPSCKHINYSDSDDGHEISCSGEVKKFLGKKRCSHKSPLPAGDKKICYDCLRAGKAIMSKDTELGMVFKESIEKELTHGLPSLENKDFEIVSGEWNQAKLGRSMIMELLTTPSYITLQGEKWLYCCKKPMAYIGEWDMHDFDRVGDSLNRLGRDYFEQIIVDPVLDYWDDGSVGDSVGCFMFRCSDCGKHRGHWDID